MSYDTEIAIDYSAYLLIYLKLYYQEINYEIFFDHCIQLWMIFQIILYLTPKSQICLVLEGNLFSKNNVSRVKWLWGILDISFWILGTFKCYRRYH